MRRLRAEAPAKINRELNVGGRRADGFHELYSRFSSIDLADAIEVETSEGLDLVCSGHPSPPGGENLVLRAARALAAAAGFEPRARIRLEKRIPIGAGLGGGSSDAALTLRLLRDLWEADVPDEALEAIASELGSDVPYFFVGGEADVRGRGELVAARPDAPPAELLLLVPPFPASTKDVFDEYAREGGGDGRLPERLAIEDSKKFLGPNELALPLLHIHVAMNAYLESAAKTASEVGISGSGSTVVLFGAQPGAASFLAQRHPEASLLRTRTIGRDQYRARTSPPGGWQWTSRR